MKFCPECAAPVRLEIPSGDNFVRHVCTRCQTVHYSNPKLVVGCVAEWHGRILLCRRAIEPRSGFWTMPSGFMENGETPCQGAMRETWEESGVRVEIQDLVALISMARINQVHLTYRARMLAASFGPTSESSEVSLFHESDIPWDYLAFRTVQLSLRLYLDDRGKGCHQPHFIDLD